MFTCFLVVTTEAESNLSNEMIELNYMSLGLYKNYIYNDIISEYSTKTHSATVYFDIFFSDFFSFILIPTTHTALKAIFPKSWKLPNNTLSFY